MITKDVCVSCQEGNIEIGKIDKDEYIHTYAKPDGIEMHRAKVTSGKNVKDYYMLELTNGMTVSGLFDVVMEDGEVKNVKSLKKGDVLRPCVINGREDNSDLTLPKVVMKVEHIKSPARLYDLTTPEYTVQAGIVVR